MISLATSSAGHIGMRRLCYSRGTFNSYCFEFSFLEFFLLLNTFVFQQRSLFTVQFLLYKFIYYSCYIRIVLFIGDTSVKFGRFKTELLRIGEEIVFTRRVYQL